MLGGPRSFYVFLALISVATVSCGGGGGGGGGIQPPPPQPDFAIGVSASPIDDNPAGEPRHRHMVYDAASQRLYVANRAMNRVEVWSGANPSLAATIDAPGATSVDLSPDAKTLWIGTAVEQILAIDAVALEVKMRYPVQGLAPIPGVVFNPGRKAGQCNLEGHEYAYPRHARGLTGPAKTRGYKS